MNYTVISEQINKNYESILNKLKNRPGLSNTNDKLATTLDDIKQYNTSYGITSNKSSSSTNGLGQAVFTTTMKAITTVGSGIGIVLNTTYNATLSNEGQPGTNYTNSLNTTDNTTQINNDGQNTIIHIIGGGIAAIVLGAGIIQTGRYVRAKLQSSIKEKPIDSNNKGAVLLVNPIYTAETGACLLIINDNHASSEDAQRNSVISHTYEEIDNPKFMRSSDPETGEDGYLLPNQAVRYENTKGMRNLPRGPKKTIPCVSRNKVEGGVQYANTNQDWYDRPGDEKKVISFVEGQYHNMDEPSYKSPTNDNEVTSCDANNSNQLVQNLSSLGDNHLPQAIINEFNSPSNDFVHLSVTGQKAL